MNLSTVVTGHNLIQPSAERAPLEFVTDDLTVAKCREAVEAIAAKRTKLDEPHGVFTASDLGIDLRDLEVLL